MSKKQIKFSLLYRDMFQSSGKYQPNISQLQKIAPVIIDMKCFDRVESNGGGFEQVQLLYGENPNPAVRTFTSILHEGGIQCHMLERGLNAIRMNPVPKDVRELFFKVKGAQGVDIARSFCGLNDVRNLELSIRYAKAAGIIAQACLAITHSPIHTVDYYIGIVDQLAEMGADEICLKDMAGVGRPIMLGELVSGMKKRHPKIPIQYHGHSGPGFTPASILEVARAGAEYIDISMEPLSWGTGHMDVITAIEMLKSDFDVPEIDMSAYMKARSLTQGFIDEFLGLYISPSNRFMNSLLIGPGLPGGMMGSLMDSLGKSLLSVNKWLKKNNKPEITQDELTVRLFNEVEETWPALGYPPLVTPFSQYVVVTALRNVELEIKGREKFTMIDDNTWGMLTGRSGKLPGPLSEKIIQLAKDKGKEFFDGNPQDLYPDNLETFKNEMKENGWELGQDDEELMELAMHPEQYRLYKSGKAKEAHEEDVRKKRDAGKSASSGKAVIEPATIPVTVNGTLYTVTIGEPGSAPPSSTPDSGAVSAQQIQHAQPSGAGAKVHAPLEGKFYLTTKPGDVAVKIGDQVTEGKVICYIESMKTFNEVVAPCDGKVQKINYKTGDDVEDDDVLMEIG